MQKIDVIRVCPDCGYNMYADGVRCKPCYDMYLRSFEEDENTTH